MEVELLECCGENHLLRPHGRVDFCGSFIDVKLRGFCSKVLSPFILLWKKSNHVFSRAKIKAIAQNFCSTLKSNTVQHLTSSACVPSCIPLCGVSVAMDHGPCSYLRPHDCKEGTGEHSGDRWPWSKREQGTSK